MTTIPIKGIINVIYRIKVRTIYLYLTDKSHIHLLTIYAKNEMEELTPSQKKVLKSITEEIKNG
ncbi:MAG: hypothetical protein ABXS91_09725 [Sulfurimonas sp.]